MRAQFIYENLDFERAEDPKTSMGIGKESKRPMIRHYFGEMAGGDLDQYEWDFTQEEIAGHTAYVIGVKANQRYGTEYFVMIPEIAVSYEEFPTAESAVSDMRRRLKSNFNETYNFERGQGPKRAMRIGKEGNPLHIVEMDEEQWEGGRVMSLDDVEAANQNTWTNSLDDENLVDYILSNWEDEIDPFYGFWIVTDDPDDPEWFHPSQLEGQFVEYKGEIYKIPKTNLFKNTSPQPV